MTGERMRQMMDLWLNETSEEDEDWREDLTEEEEALVEEWDERFATGVTAISTDILTMERR